MKENILIGLRSLAKEEEKRIDEAKKYLRQIEQAVAQDLFTFLGENSNERSYSFTIVLDDKLYFNYNLHPRNDNPSIVGFYTAYLAGYNILNRRIISVQGNAFWFYVSRILAWIEDMPNRFEVEVSKRKVKFERLEKMVGALKEEG